MDKSEEQDIEVLIEPRKKDETSIKPIKTSSFFRRLIYIRSILLGSLILNIVFTLIYTGAGSQFSISNPERAPYREEALRNFF